MAEGGGGLRVAGGGRRAEGGVLKVRKDGPDARLWVGPGPRMNNISTLPGVLYLYVERIQRH